MFKKKIQAQSRKSCIKISSNFHGILIHPCLITLPAVWNGLGLEETVSQFLIPQPKRSRAELICNTPICLRAACRTGFCLALLGYQAGKWASLFGKAEGGLHAHIWLRHDIMGGDIPIGHINQERKAGVRFCEIKTFKITHVYPLGWLFKKKISVGKCVEKLEPLCIAGGNLKWWNCCGRQYNCTSKK